MNFCLIGALYCNVWLWALLVQRKVFIQWWSLFRWGYQVHMVLEVLNVEVLEYCSGLLSYIASSTPVKENLFSQGYFSELLYTFEIGFLSWPNCTNWNENIVSGFMRSSTGSTWVELNPRATDASKAVAAMSLIVNSETTYDAKLRVVGPILSVTSPSWSGALIFLIMARQKSLKYKLYDL